MLSIYDLLQDQDDKNINTLLILQYIKNHFKMIYKKGEKDVKCYVCLENTPEESITLCDDKRHSICIEHEFAHNISKCGLCRGKKNITYVHT